ncbi:MAG: hypothetical protein H6739_20680 [Alphaproteobacteria bacterium]|nr:hypothetical protein [Alphaproteobacteria bacterium]
MSTIARMLHAIRVARAGGDRLAYTTAVGQLVNHLGGEVSISSAEAQLCLQELDDHRVELAPIVQRLEAQLGRAPPRTASAWALLVTPEGEGRLGRLTVSVYPGRGTQVPHVKLGQESAQACTRAIHAALGVQLGAHLVLWDLDVEDESLFAVDGASLGLPLAVATRCALEGINVPDDIGFTGGVGVDGRVSAVGGLSAKLAAASGRLTRVFVPEGSTLPEAVEVEAVAVRDLRDAVARFATRPVAPAPTPRWLRWAGGMAMAGLGVGAWMLWPEPTPIPAVPVRVCVDGTPAGRGLRSRQLYTLSVSAPGGGGVQLLTLDPVAAGFSVVSHQDRETVFFPFRLEPPERLERLVVLRGAEPLVGQILPDPTRSDAGDAWSKSLGETPWVPDEPVVLRTVGACADWSAPVDGAAALVVDLIYDVEPSG